MKRYFKTFYETETQYRVLLHNNDQGNLPDRLWLKKVIAELNFNKVIKNIKQSEEIDKEEYDRLLKELPDA